MYLIPCSDRCIYQHEGYCMLETTASVTNSLPGRCVHYISNDCYNEKQKIHDNTDDCNS